MNKHFLLLALFLLPSFVSAYTYERNPETYNVDNPISFNYSHTSCIDELPSMTGDCWGRITIYSDVLNGLIEDYGACENITGNTNITHESFSFPEIPLRGVILDIAENENDCNAELFNNSITLEYSDNNVIFTLENYNLILTPEKAQYYASDEISIDYGGLSQYTFFYGAEYGYERINYNFEPSFGHQLYIGPVVDLGNGEQLNGGTFYIVELTVGGLEDSSCMSNFLDCQNSPYYNGVTYEINWIPDNQQNGVMALVNSTEAGFQSTTGESVGGVVTWTGNNLVKLFLGSALAVLLGLIGWFVAIAIVVFVVSFGIRAYKNRRGGERVRKLKVKSVK